MSNNNNKDKISSGQIIMSDNNSNYCVVCNSIGINRSSVTDVNGRLKRNREKLSKNPRWETAGSNVLAPNHTVLVHPIFRCNNNQYQQPLIIHRIIFLI